MRKRKRWDRHAIKAEIHRRGGTLLGIAADAGLEPSSTRVALHRRHPAGELAISAFLSIEPSELWPERYHSRVTTPALHTADDAASASLKRLTA
ncbi:helix-turn-helix domain-containing protein [Kaistia sp. MMO-174]|uniref:helix-turn-helix domain-containing protein n=1 Tax=Kaistia sp. MMO-174 TaxID=3081256 RepID=UPI003015F003